MLSPLDGVVYRTWALRASKRGPAVLAAAAQRSSIVGARRRPVASVTHRDVPSPDSTTRFSVVRRSVKKCWSVVAAPTAAALTSGSAPAGAEVDAHPREPE